MLPFYRSDPLAEADALSRAVVHLLFLAPNLETGAEEVVASGSGIVWLDPHAHCVYLVTAWHNLSGKEPLTRRAKHSEGILPWKVRIRGFYFDHTETLRIGDGNPDTHAPKYWVHPKGSELDIAVLPLTGVNKCNCSFEILFGGPLPQVYVAEQVFVIGFPLGLVNEASPHHPYPIWKVGNIANDPGPNFNGQPRFLIDATTLPGMSGAPVIRRYDYMGNPHHVFLGIYVGRYVVPRGKRDRVEALGNEPADQSSALGWVVKPSVVFDTLNTREPPVDITL